MAYRPLITRPAVATVCGVVRRARAAVSVPAAPREPMIRWCGVALCAKPTAGPPTAGTFLSFPSRSLCRSAGCESYSGVVIHGILRNDRIGRLRHFNIALDPELSKKLSDHQDESPEESVFMTQGDRSPTPAVVPVCLRSRPKMSPTSLSGSLSLTAEVRFPSASAGRALFFADNGSVSDRSFPFLLEPTPHSALPE